MPDLFIDNHTTIGYFYGKVKVSERDSTAKLYSQIKDLVQTRKPVVLTTWTFSRSSEAYMEQALGIFLEITGQKSLTDYAVYFVRELMNNAKKANTKRVYFAEKNLDINNEEDYRRGMETFKADMLRNKQRYLTLHQKQGLYIRLKLWEEAHTVKIEVSNNAAITSSEKSRLKNKLEMGGHYSSLEGALVEAVDETEGAGLGIIILVLMMKKIGLETERIWIETGANETKIGVEIPSK